MGNRRLSVNKRTLIRWNLVSGNNGITYEKVYLVSTNTDKRMDGEDVLYINKTGSIIGPHLVDLFKVRCLPHCDGMTIKGFIRVEYPASSFNPSGKIDFIPRRYYATLDLGKKAKRDDKNKKQRQEK